jgi:hypothetical protein
MARSQIGAKNLSQQSVTVSFFSMAQKRCHKLHIEKKPKKTKYIFFQKLNEIINNFLYKKNMINIAIIFCSLRQLVQFIKRDKLYLKK